MNAEVKIRIGVTSKYRKDFERFRPSATYTHSFIYDTDLENYITVTGPAATEVWGYSQAEIANGREIDLKISITLSNPTHPTPATGVIPLAKGHRDFGLTQLQFTTVGVLQANLDKVITELKEQAKY